MIMKRTLSFVLAAICVFALAVTCASAAQITVDKYKNLALGKSYTTPQAYNIPADGSSVLSGYRDVNGDELTDGKYGENDVVGTDWLGFTTTLTGGSVHSLTVDLGEKQTGINRLNVVAGIMKDWGIDLPASVEYFASDDGGTFASVGTATAISDGMLTTYRLESEKGFEGRYFRADVKHGAGFFVFISEFEICVRDGTEVIEVPDPEPDTLNLVGNSIMFFDDDGDLRGAHEQQTVNDFSYYFTDLWTNIKILNITT